MLCTAANLAAFLTRRSSSSYVQSLQQAERVCVPSGSMTYVRQLYPVNFFIPISYGAFVGDPDAEWDSKGCNAVVFSLNMLKRSPRLRTFMCQRQLFASQRILDLPVAFPAASSFSTNYAAILSSALAGYGAQRQYLDYETIYYAENCAEVYSFNAQEQTARSRGGS
jgi:hypothetical protein